ncbi:MAG: insulinase family protein [Firmicutes bacterium]|nr:insulinase family protein [Alicyclobacillaceae bacterium]MCL6496823.1 insulinase family protein [Bacillota bacterium]
MAQWRQNGMEARGIGQVWRLGNGARLVREARPSEGPLSVAIVMGVGSRHEVAEAEWGAAHFLEHAVFKGAGAWDGKGLAAWMDRLGGEVNAFTTRDYTCYYAKVLPEFGDSAFELLTTMVFDPRLDPEDLDRERAVIAEEILEAEDDLEDRCEAAYLAALYPDPTFTHEILGTAQSIAGLDRERLVAFHRRWYQPAHTIFAVAGEGAWELAERLLARHGGRNEDDRYPKGPGATLPVQPREVVERVDRDQVHWMVGAPAPPPPSWRAALVGEVAATVMAGQNSARLWQRLREERGLVYTLQSGYSAHRDRAEMSVYAVVSPAKLEEALRVTGDEIAALATGAQLGEAVERAKVQVETAVRFQWETSDGRMLHLVRHVLEGAKAPPTLEEMVAGIRTIEEREVQAVLAETWGDPARWAVAAVGPVPRRWTSLRTRLGA